MYLREIPFAEALARAIDGETGIRIAMPQPLEKMSIEEVLNLQKSGTCCLLEEEPSVPIVTGEPGPVDPESPPNSKRKRIDRGKVKALHAAGWKNKDIAEEVRCSEWSVCQILKEEL